MPESILVYTGDPRYSMYIKRALSEKLQDIAILAVNTIPAARKALEASKTLALIAEIDSNHPEEERSLASLMVDHSAMPCVIIAEENDDLTREKAFAMGALAFAHKSEEIKRLIDRVTAFVKPGSEGGKLFSISPHAIAQMIQMEQRSCTIQAQSTKSNKSGCLYFSEGTLMEARMDAKTGQEAAIEILLWDEVNIRIHNFCPVEAKRVFDSLESLLLQTEKLRDEQNANRIAGDMESENEPIEYLMEELEEDPELKVDLYDRLCGFLNGKRGIVDVNVDPTWDKSIDFARKAAGIFDYGKLLTCHISDSHLRHDLVLLPEKDTIAISVDKSSAKDAMIDLALSFGG